MLLLVCPLVVRSERSEPARGVQLFRQTRTHLEFTPEGASILRDAPRPFCIVSIVGPTRTGKSALIGRCFATPASFEVGGDLFSKTSGVWISDRPRMMRVGEGADARTVAVYVLDTEGFHGVLQRTTRSFEANMFAAVCLMSSVVIYNSRAPLDAKDVERLRTFATTTAMVVEELAAHGLGDVAQLQQPSLIWAVQNINFRHLDAALARLRREAPQPVAPHPERASEPRRAGARPSEADLAQLTRALLAGTRDAAEEVDEPSGAGDERAGAKLDGAPAVALLARTTRADGAERDVTPRDERDLTPRAVAANALSDEVEEGLSEGEWSARAAVSRVFRSVELVPLHAPHHDDDILADLSAATDAQLSREYVRDMADLFKRCARRLQPMRLAGVELNGEACFWRVERWLLEGRVHMPEPSVAASIVEAQLRRACALLLREYSAAATGERAPSDASADGRAPPHVAHELGMAACAHDGDDCLGESAIRLDAQALARIAEPHDCLAARLVIARNDATAQFDALCARWLGDAAAPTRAASDGARADDGRRAVGAAHLARPLAAHAAAAIASRERAALGAQLDERMAQAMDAYARAAKHALDELAAQLCSRGEGALDRLCAADFVRWSAPLAHVEQGLAQAVGEVVARAQRDVASAAEYYGLRAPSLDQLENAAFVKLQQARAQIDAHRTARARLLRLARAVRAMLLFAALNALDAWRRGRWGGALESSW